MPPMNIVVAQETGRPVPDQLMLDYDRAVEVGMASDAATLAGIRGEQRRSGSI
jgi:hypothetical protein